jgi:nitrogen regulatory protein P-II 1
MKEIKAYVHANRISDVIQALKTSSHWSGEDVKCEHNLTVYKVHGSLRAMDGGEQRYSVELGEEVIAEYKLELICEDHEADELIDIIAREARTGQARAGWIVVTDIARAVSVG